MTKKRSSLSEEAVVLVARRFAVLGEPMRLRLVHALIDGEKHVGALVQETGGTQANVSRHLQTLAQSGIIRRRKDGLQVFYEVADPSIFELCDVVCRSILEQAEQAARAMNPAPGGGA